jgi:hypothetical protein
MTGDEDTIGDPALDGELMADLRRIAAVADPVPGDVTAFAHAALATRRLDEELAALLLDSALAGADAVRAGESDVRLLSFETSAVTLELQVEHEGGRISLRGLAVGTTGPAEVETPGQRRSVVIDQDGWFTARDLPAGPARVHVRAAGGGPVVTGWVRL